MTMTRLLLAVVSIGFVLLVVAEKESVLHGHVAGNKPHDEHEDHKIVLGSEKLASEFDDLSPEESKKRLRVLATKMDANGDGTVSKDELTDWIENSSRNLDKEENDERFMEMDADKDGFVTWQEYIAEAFYGAGEEGVIDVDKLDAEDRKLFHEDRRYFEHADENKDDKLSRDEFSRFQNPELYNSMHDILVTMTLVEKDANHDGKIDIREFMGDVFDQPNSEFYITEQNRFKHDYDTNKDGFLSGDELRAWIVPDLRVTALQEAEHLFEGADSNKDGVLSIDEIVAAYALFVGSEATNYGEHILALPHEEL
uniref:Reticulocalbin-3 n=1 Tax=Panagrellus redivivus TaxID=6233 RepID=A0A7E5A1Q9_PANRE